MRVDGQGKGRGMGVDAAECTVTKGMGVRDRYGGLMYGGVWR